MPAPPRAPRTGTLSVLMPARRIPTLLIHEGEPRPRIAGAVSMPVFQSSTFETGTEAGEGYHRIRYLRLNNSPNHEALHHKLAAIEGTQAALVTGSGMAAIFTTLLTLLRPGDHVIAQRCLYGGTHDLLRCELTELGIEHTFVDAADSGSWAAAVRPSTKVVYAESLTNPLLEVGDLPGLAAFAREHGLLSIIDNTFATPINFRPVEHGFDLVVHSATKYLNGHSDLVAGVVAGGRDHIEAIKRRLDHTGATLDPHACFLLHRGLKTLAVRMRHHNEAALELARFLESHPAVQSVRYPGLPSHPDHGRARELMPGHSGMLAFEVAGGLPVAQRVMSKLRLAVDAPSLGGPETLVTRPAQTSHAGLSAEERAALGIGDGLIRVSVGLESSKDLIADFEQALTQG